MSKTFVAMLIAFLHITSGAVEVRFEKLAEGVYVHVGDIGGRTPLNEALNANIGLVLTPGGAVLIDSGATHLSARDIDQAARRLADQPIRWVINTGGQDHRWLGNSYFQAQGAELIAHASAVPDMRARGGDQLQNDAFIDPVSPRLLTLPDGWEDRMKLISRNGIKAFFLDANDAAISKYTRGAPNDMRWIQAGIRAGLIDLDAVVHRLPSTRFLDEDEARATRQRVALDRDTFASR
jgi:hypothetical protein